METKNLTFGEGVVEVTIIDNIIYMKTLMLYTDEMAMEMTRYLDKIIDLIPSNLIRIWDSSHLPSECFKLTEQCVETIVRWSQGVKERSPDSRVYFIAQEPLIFGISRMYELQTNAETMNVTVLNSIDELPDDIRTKLPI